MFNAFAEKLREFSFGLAVERDGVALARVYGTGVVVLTEPQQIPVTAAPSASGSGSGGGGAVVAPGAIWAVTDLRDPRPYRMAAIPAAAASAAAATAAGAVGAAAAAAAQRPGVPQALAVLDPRHTLSMGLEVRPLSVTKLYCMSVCGLALCVTVAVTGPAGRARRAKGAIRTKHRV